MAIKHFLALDIPETACSTIIKINDGSVYGDNMAVDCLRLDILLPGTTQPIYITASTLPALVPGFVLNLSGIELGLQQNNSSTLVELPDGLYTITYSVSPNDLVNVTYYHLRVTKTLYRLYQERCKIMLAPCEPTAETLQLLAQLRYIKDLIDTAKAKAEYCHAPIQGADMLIYAIKLLGKFNTDCCTTCN